MFSVQIWLRTLVSSDKRKRCNGNYLHAMDFSVSNRSMDTQERRFY